MQTIGYDPRLLANFLPRQAISSSLYLAGLSSNNCPSSNNRYLVVSSSCRISHRISNRYDLGLRLGYEVRVSFIILL